MKYELKTTKAIHPSPQKTNEKRITKTNMYLLAMTAILFVNLLIIGYGLYRFDKSSTAPPLRLVKTPITVADSSLYSEEIQGHKLEESDDIADKQIQSAEILKM